ncbi:Alpha/beta hydrolase fold-3 [Cordyceps fumosorosea ARSEF 2679]|uniref:Alpha/beta hydrolase fold-3 n=1 Tax=Cordyceps fumosorosea (strain ARSEF 2679) TaxID=1081104 RepID=A0A167T252_CORFA|nr:Alpha/beta hydrolase fold-3 [Cordyceps fumosorosea ARSEF 2679]OAA60170.1 Alpha/beta hydrolase fold-3 [Cordyceps fumosorosea ARSEF 2679]
MPQPPRPWRATQPLKALCITYFYLSTPPWLVYLLLKFALIRGLRPSPHLSLKANVGNPIVRSLFNVMSRTRSPRLVAERLPKDPTRVTAVEVPPASLFTGVLASDPAIQPAPLNALWFPRAPPPETDLAEETVVLHLPGGAFVVEVGHEAFGRKAADAMLHGRQSGTTRFVWAQYRLASTPGHAFPAAIQDAVSFYAHVLSLGYAPGNVILSGDSAGGNAALALLRYLHATRTLPLPRGVLAWSPWVAVTPRAGIDFMATPAAPTDIITPEFLQWGADAYPPAEMGEEVAGYVSPLGRPFRTEVPVFLHAGAAEGFCAAVRRFAEEMEGVNPGAKVRYHETAHAVHDLLLVWEAQDMRTEVEAAVRDAWETVGA